MTRRSQFGSGSPSNPVSVNGIEFVGTDMSAAEVQTVIDELASSGGGKVVWTSGTFEYSSTTTTGETNEKTAIELKSDIEYLGQGYSTHIVQAEDDMNIFAAEYDYDGATSNEDAGEVENIRIANMRLDGDKANRTNNDTGQNDNGIWTPFIRDSTFENIWAGNFHQHGIHPDASIDLTISNCWVTNCGRGYHVATRGISADDIIYGPVRTTLSKCRAWSCEGGVDLPAATNCMVENSHMRNMTVAGFTGSGDGVTFDNCRSIDCTIGVNVTNHPLDSNGNTQHSTNFNVDVNCVNCDEGIKAIEHDNVTVTGDVDTTTSGVAVLFDDCVDAGTLGVEITDPSGRGVYYQNGASGHTKATIVRNTSDQAFFTGAAAGTVVFSDCDAYNVDASGFTPAFELNATNGKIADATVENAGRIITVDASDCRIKGVSASSINSQGILANSSGAYLSDVVLDSIGNEGIKVDAADIEISGGKITNTGQNAGQPTVNVSSNGQDTIIDLSKAPDGINDSGTRTVFGGVIGGGPLGGTDIGSLTGASEGDLARADGTTGDSDALYILKSNGDWQALHDPTTTITPA